MVTIAVIGANGFVGQNICKEINTRKKNKLVKVTRQDDLSTKILNCDIIIHAANPAGRFYANQNSSVDYRESVEKTQKIVELSEHKKIVLISSISSRTELDSYYGRHRKSCEILINFNDNLVLRLGPMFGGTRTKDTLHDIINGRKVYLSDQTKYSYVNVSYSAKKVVDLIDKTGIYEIGAKNAISLRNIADQLNSSSTFIGRNDTQIAMSPQYDAPESSLVVQYAKKQLILC